MAYSIWMLEESDITVSGGVTLDGITQGDGSHLVGETVRLLSTNWLEVPVADNDVNFDDNDSNQVLDGDQTINGTPYTDGTVIEAEYSIILEDPDTGEQYQVLAVNIRDSNPSYATVEGLVFVGGVGGFPPTGVDLTVLSATEGPGSSGQPSIPADSIAVPCFTRGTRIATPYGIVPIETLTPGDLVLTRDHGAQPLRWIGLAELPTERLAMAPSLRPILIRAGAFGPDRPARDLLVSPQHRILVDGWRAELLFGEREVLVAAKHLIDDRNVVRGGVGPVCYVHLLFDQHEVILAEGLATESFLPGPVTLPGMADEARAELFTIFPDLAVRPAGYGPAARPLLQRWEGATLAG